MILQLNQFKTSLVYMEDGLFSPELLQALMSLLEKVFCCSVWLVCSSEQVLGDCIASSVATASRKRDDCSVFDSGCQGKLFLECLVGTFGQKLSSCCVVCRRTGICCSNANSSRPLRHCEFDCGATSFCFVRLFLKRLCWFSCRRLEELPISMSLFLELFHLTVLLSMHFWRSKDFSWQAQQLLHNSKQILRRIFRCKRIQEQP